MKPSLLALIAAALLLGGCTERDQQSVSDGLWYMFTSHPQPIVLKRPPPPVYCYETIGVPDCYEQPRE